MAGKKSGLGRGLDALFPEKTVQSKPKTTVKTAKQTNIATPETKKSSQHENSNGERMMKLSMIEPNREQPRKKFDEDALQELADSIKQYGVLQPLLVSDKKDYYEIVAGERRWRAAKLAGLKEVPVVVRELSTQEIVEISLIENIQREDLNAIEEAQAYKAMMDKMNLTQEELAGRIGKSRTHVTNTLRLLNINEKLQQYILEGILSMGHVRPLVGLDDETALKIANRAIKEKLSVRQVEDIVRGYKLAQKRKNAPKKEKNTTYTYAEDLLRKKFRTKVKVEEKTITLKYSDTEDLNRILEIMGVIEDI